MAKIIADQLVEMLVEAGVKRIYAVTGDSLNKVNDAVHRDGRIQWIHVRHEETGAFAAGAEAQLHGGLGCCAGSSGPGHVHLINGLYDAQRTGASVLAIASTIPSIEFGTKYFQETNPAILFNDCSYYNQLALSAGQFPRMLQSAMQIALTYKGVAVVGLPGDIAGEKVEGTYSSERIFPTYQRICPSKTELHDLANLLNENTNITLFCGIGAKEAHEEILELSHRLQAPVAYTFKGKMDIQYNNPNEVGMTGLLGMSSGYNSMHEADVLLMLGTDFPYSSFLPSNNKIIQIDINPAHLGRRANLTMGLCGDIKTTLNALLPLIKAKTDNSFLHDQLLGYAKVKENLETYVNKRGAENKIHPEYVMSMVDETASSDAIFTVDTGMTCVWGARYLNASGQRRMIGSFNHGTMANAMPQAIGAAFAYPQRQIIALCGDGGLSMLLGDLETIVQYKLPIKIIVFNNRSLGMVKLEMEVAGLPDNETEMQNPDFALVAQAMGMTGMTVKTPEEVLPALIKAFNSTEPILINIMTDPNALAMPPAVSWDQMTGFAKAMYKMLITGRTQDIMDTINSNYKHIKEAF